MYVYIKGTFQDTIYVTQWFTVPVDEGIWGLADSLKFGANYACFEAGASISQVLRRVKGNLAGFLSCQRIVWLLACAQI